MATYYDDSGTEITYEQWKANKEKKEVEKKKVKDTKTEDTYKGNKKLAKQTWEFLTKKQTVNQPFDVWLKGINKNTNGQAKVHSYLLDQGAIDQDFTTWRNGFIGSEALTEKEAGPTFLVNGETLDINGVPVNIQGNATKEVAADFEGELKNIQAKVDNLRENPLQNSETKKADIVATNAAIKEIQANTPSMLEVKDDLGEMGYITPTANLTDQESKNFSSELKQKMLNLGFGIDESTNRFINEENVEWNYDSNLSEKENEDLKKIIEQLKGKDGALTNFLTTKLQKELSAPVIEERKDLLEKYNNGEVELTTKELASIFKPTQGFRDYLETFAPKDLDYSKGDVDVIEDIYMPTINGAIEADPRFKSIQQDITNNIQKQSQSKMADLAEEFVDFNNPTQAEIERAQDEFTDWYNKEYQTQIKDNKVAGNLYQEYGVAASDFFKDQDFISKRRNDTTGIMDYIDSLKAPYLDKQTGRKKQGAEPDWKYATGQFLESIVKHAVDINDKDKDGFDLKDVGLGSGLKSVKNQIEIGVNQISATARKKIVKELDAGFKDGTLNRDMTVGKAREILGEDSVLEDRLEFFGADMLRGDSLSLGEYYDIKKDRNTNMQEALADDIKSMMYADKRQTMFSEMEIEGDFNVFDAVTQLDLDKVSLTGLISRAAQGVEQVQNFLPSIVSTSLYTTSAALALAPDPTLATKGLAAATFKAAVTVSAIGALVEGSQTYGSVFMEGLKKQMDEEYGEGGYDATEYLEALTDPKYQQNLSPALTGLGVSAVSFGVDAIVGKIGGGIATRVAASGIGKTMMANTLSNFILTKAIPPLATLGVAPYQEYLEEGFQSYIEQVGQNFIAKPGEEIDSPFTKNIDWNQIRKEAEMGKAMGELFGLGGLSASFKSGQSYTGQAQKIAANIDMSPNSPTFAAGNKAFDDLLNKINNDKNLNPIEKAAQVQELSDIRKAAIKSPANLSDSDRAKLTELLKNKYKLDRVIKQVDDVDISAQDIARRKEISAEIQSLMQNSKKPPASPGAAGAAAIVDPATQRVGPKKGGGFEILEYSPDFVVAPESMQDVVNAEETLNKVDAAIELRPTDSVKKETYSTTFSEEPTTLIFTTKQDGSREIRMRNEDGDQVFLQKLSKDNPISNEQYIKVAASDEGSSIQLTETLEGYENIGNKKSVARRKAEAIAASEVKANDSYEQTNKLLANEDFDIESSLDQKTAIQKAGGIIEATTKRLWRQGSLLTRDQFKKALENEYLQSLIEYDADRDLGDNAGKSISNKFNLRAGKIARENLGKGEAASLDSEQARQVADTTEQKDFDEVQAQESEQREKVYASQTDQVDSLDTVETKAIIKDEMSKDILLAASKGKNAADTAKDIANESKQTYFKRLRKDIGTFSSQKYKDFVNSLDKNFIKSLPVATIKRRFGKLFGIKQTGTTKTKQTSKSGKPSYFNKPVFSVPKITNEGLQQFKQYFLGGEKRQQSLYNILATDFALESMQELIADKDFMGKLQTALGNDGITALEFMQNIENKLDARVKEDSSLDVIDKKTAKKSNLQDLTKPKKILPPGQETVDGTLRLVNKPKKQLSKKTIENAFNEKGAEGINTLIDAFDPNFRKLSIKEKIAAQKVMLENLIKNGMPIKTLLKAANLSPGYSFPSLIKRGLQWVNDKAALDKRKGRDFDQTREAFLRGEIGDIKAFALEMQKKYAQTTDSDITAALQGRAIGTKGIKSRAEADVANSAAIIRGREKILNIVRKLGPSDKAAFIDFLYSNSNLNQNIGRAMSPIFGFQQIYAPLSYAINKKGKKYVTNPIINEHVLQFNNQVKMIASLLDASSKTYKDGVKYLDNNQFQIPIQGVAQELTYTTLDGGKWKAKDGLHPRLKNAWESFLRGEIDWTQIPDGIIRYFNEYFYLNPNNVFFRNTANNKIESAAKVYNAEIKGSIKVDGKTYTGKQLMSMNPEGKAMFPNVEKLQATAVNLVASKELSIDQVQDFINANLPAAIAMNEANFVIQENLPDLFQKICNSPCRVPKTSEQVKKTLNNSLDTHVNAQKTSKATKGISVFDFDDTLATTNSQVIVNMPDGSISKIDASEFATQSVNLENAGATFNFDEFNKVVDGKKGPLADLALKRQNKFGSGDIFVLTARPQASAQGIKTFLDGIGLNLPIENITGLENGSPQAKAEWILSKTADGYNDFYFADDAIKNVKAVKEILDQVDIKSRVQQAIVNKVERLNTEFNKQIEDVTGKESFKTYSKSRATLEGTQKDKGLINWLGNQLTLTASAEDFMGLMYDLIGKGKEGSRHKKWILDNLVNPYNKAEKALLSAKVSVAKDFAALRDKFPSLKTKTFGSNPLLESIGVGPYTKSQAMRVYMWTKQGMSIPGLSQRDQNALVAAVEANPELRAFADQVILIQKDQQYPAPGNSWVSGNISSDIMSSLDKGFRRKLMTEFDENIDIIFSEDNMNKLEALYGSKWVEALKDSLRRMKSGSNRPVYQGGGSRVVNELLDWLNGSVGAIMFLNMRSGLLQLTSAVNFINWGDNNIYAASKAFANQKQYWKDVIRLMNSDYLVNRRDGLKINVNEAELVDAGKKGGMKGALAYFLDKGFLITRIMDSLAIGTGGATFFRNRIDALLKRINPATNKTYTLVEAETRAFEDFYAIAEESQQSSNPSKISQQQASLAGRVILSFQNTTMQYMRMNKKAVRDLYNRRKNPGQTQRESDLGNISKIMYYTTIQNVIFHSLQQALFAGLFQGGEEGEEEDNKTASIANGMLDSLLFGLGFGGAAISTVKNVVLELAKQGEKKAPKYEEAVWSVFDFSPVLDSKVRKLRSGFKSLSWNMDEMKRRGWSLDNPAYLAIAQIVAAGTNAPLDRVLRKIMNIRAALDEETRVWQKVSLMMGWDTWSVGLPYWGLQSTIRKEEAEDEKIKANFKADVRKLKADGYKKTMTPEKFDNVVEMKSPYGTVMYYYKIIKNK